MGKKVLIAAIIAVVALVVCNTTRIGSHLRLWKKQAGTYIQSQIPPEQEIARLEMELKNLEATDQEAAHRVAKQEVALKSMRKEVEVLVKERDTREARIAAMKTAEKGTTQFVDYGEKRYSRDQFKDQLRTLARSFQVFEQTVGAKEKQLEIEEKSYQSNREKFLNRKRDREMMRAELAELKLALEQEKQEQAAQAKTIDDGPSLKLRNDMNSVRERIDVLKAKRILLSEVESPVRAAEQKKEADAAIDRFLETRFGDKADNK